ncbi:MAG: hypothetical protein QNJ84_11920 [Alphaproteobacteria bacterium]|nr:hypothetical protein [Alphaproteobacteria bacterium]
MTDKDIAIRLSLQDGEKVRRGLMRLGEDGQNALARIERQTRPASRGLLAVNAVSAELRGSMAGLSGRLGAVGAGLGAMGPAGLAGAAGIGAIVLALGGLMRASVTAANELALIQDEAQQAGAAVETFQALRFAAEEYSVSQNALTDGLRELNLRADEFVTTGGGSAAEAFERLGFSQEELQGQLGDTGAMFLEVIRRMQSLEGEAARIRVADEIFGGEGGEQFIRLVGAGEDAIRNLMGQARELGFVLDENMIQRADEARDRMAQLQRLISVSFNSALLELVPIAQSVAEGFAEVARWVADVTDGFRDLENQSTRGLERRLEELDAYFASNTRPASGRARRNFDAFGDERDRITEVLMARQARRSDSQTAPRVSGQTGASQAQADRIGQVTDSLRFQLDQLTRTEQGRRVFQTLQRAGIDANHQEAQSIAALVLEVGRQEQADRDATRAKADGAAMTRRLMTADERRAETLAGISNLLSAGAITEVTAARARDEATRTFVEAERRRLEASQDASAGIQSALMQIRDASQNTAQRWRDDIQGMNDGARTAFVDIVTGASTMAQGLESVLGGIQRQLAGRFYDRAVGGVVDGLLDGFFGANHGGGMVGEPSFRRRVNPLAFAGAPRLHAGGMVPGLRPGETPIIALRGERVLTEAQQDNTAKTIAGLAAMARPAAPAVNVVVNNTAGRVAEARAETSQGAGGGLNLEIMIEEIETRMTRNVARGEGLAPVVERRYGLDPAVGAQR